jgi:hypothetical protein
LQKDFRVLFHEDGMPIDSRCIAHFVKAFPKGYRTVVEKIIANSEMLNPQTFEENLKLLLPSFKMTRAGIFHSPKTRALKRFCQDCGIVLEPGWGRLRVIEENRNKCHSRT